MKAASLILVGLGLVFFASPACAARTSLTFAASIAGHSAALHLPFLLGLAQPEPTSGGDQEVPTVAEPEEVVTAPPSESETDTMDSGSQPVEGARPGPATPPSNRSRRAPNPPAAVSGQDKIRTAAPNRSTRSPSDRQGPQPSSSRRRPNTNARPNDRRPGASDNGPADKLVGEYARFKIITDRNIFNANRSARASRDRGEERAPAHVDTLSLVGTLSSEKGEFAFFDGSSSEYRKVLPVGKTMAGYTIAEINGSAVNLVSGTNSLDVRVGMQLRREDGEWRLVGNNRPTTGASVSGTSASTELSSSDESDVVKRLMLQREQELK